jgi:hypothetical protein
MGVVEMARDRFYVVVAVCVVRVVRVVCVVGLVWLMAPALAAGSAEAGEYHVYSCRTPAGAVAPTDGWTGSVDAEGAYDDYALDTCESGGALIAALGDATIHKVDVDSASWTFNVSTGESMIGATLWRAGDTDGGNIVNATYQYRFSGAREIPPFDECIYASGCESQGDPTQVFSSLNSVVMPVEDLGTRIHINVDCGGTVGSACQAGKGDAHEYAAAVYMYAADLTLEQTAGPTASNVSGELATASAVRGTSDVAFDASDPGSGVYEAVFSVDGQTVQTTALDENGGHCVNVGGTSDGLPAFLYVQPCESSVSVDVPFDTTHLANGTHHLIVSVIDAAGNSAPVLDREITIANPPPPGTPGPPNGTNASTQATLTAAWVGSSRTRIAGAYGHAHTIAGRLTVTGGTTPIAGAQLDCTATPAYQGATAAAMACPKTGADGRFTVRVPGDVSSRTIALAYRAHLGDALPVATRTLALTVRAGVRLRVAPHVTSVGHTIHFTGTLLGGPLPHGGKQLVLEARSPGGRWIEFDVVRSDGRGRFHDSYTFKFPGPVDYRFRALSESEADYPYATGASNVVRVHER